MQLVLSGVFPSTVKSSQTTQRCEQAGYMSTMNLLLLRGKKLRRGVFIDDDDDDDFFFFLLTAFSWCPCNGLLCH